MSEHILPYFDSPSGAALRGTLSHRVLETAAVSLVSDLTDAAYRVFRGASAENREGIAVRVASLRPTRDDYDGEWRGTLELAGRSTELQRFPEIFTALALKFPLAGKTVSGAFGTVVFSRLNASECRFAQEECGGAVWATAVLTLDFRLDMTRYAAAAIDCAVLEEEARAAAAARLAAFDAVALEKGLAAFLGAKMGLALDREIFRKHLPPTAEDGCFVRLESFRKNAGETFDAVFLLCARALDRDRLVGKFTRLCAELPLSGEVFAESGCRIQQAASGSGASFATVSDGGRSRTEARMLLDCVIAFQQGE